jgi:hypothetical protein
MWDPQRLTTLWAFTVWYRDSFTFFFFTVRRTGWLMNKGLTRIHCYERNQRVVRCTQHPSWCDSYNHCPWKLLTYLHTYLNRSSYNLGCPGCFFFHLIILQNIGLFGRVISLSQGLYLNTGQQKHRKTHTHTKHPCLMWDSNPGYRLPNEWRQYMPQTARLLCPIYESYTLQKYNFYWLFNISKLF